MEDGNVLQNKKTFEVIIDDFKGLADCWSRYPCVGIQFINGMN